MHCTNGSKGLQSQEVVQFRDANDMIQQLNGILAKPVGFPQISDPRKDCHLFQANPGECHQQYVLCPEQDCEWLVYMSDQNTSMIEALDVQDHPLWNQRMQDYHDWQQKINKGSKTSKESWTWQEGTSSKWPTSSSRGSSKRGQSVPVDISKRTNPEEKGLPWRDLGELNVDMDYLYPSDTVIPCPVEKSEQLSPEQQVTYIQWIVYCFNLLDHKVDKDPRVYCSYCDMNNHPRFTCKHVNKHRKPMEKHHCTLCAAKHPPFLCPRAQVNGGPAQPNWYKTEYKRAKQENREADYRWGPMVTHDDVDGPDSTSQHQMEAPQPVCAAAAMMHGMPMAPASSIHGGCPSFAEHQEFTPCMPPPEMTMMQCEVITPNPGYKIPANLWDLNIAHCAHAPTPLATFIRHCNTMESPYYPTYSKQGVSVPADSMSDLNHGTSSIENLKELQKYSEKLAYESTCCRLWADGIQTHITDEQEKVHAWIAGMTEDLLRMKRIQHAQPHWAQPMLHPCQPAPPASPSGPSQPSSSSSASMVPVKPAPMAWNSSMASAPPSSQSPPSMGIDPWAEDEATTPVKSSMAQSEQMIAVHVQKESNGIR